MIELPIRFSEVTYKGRTYQYDMRYENREPKPCYRCRHINEGEHVYVVHEYPNNPGQEPYKRWWCEACFAAVFQPSVRQQDERSNSTATTQDGRFMRLLGACRGLPLLPRGHVRAAFNLKESQLNSLLQHHPIRVEERGQEGQDLRINFADVFEALEHPRP